jgi:hypothetical protein
MTPSAHEIAHEVVFFKKNSSSGEVGFFKKKQL